MFGKKNSQYRNGEDSNQNKQTKIESAVDILTNVTNSILETLKEYIILVNSSGMVVFTNRDITSLLTAPRVTPSKVPGNKNSKDNNSFAKHNLLTELLCPDLITDLNAALRAGTKFSALREGVKKSLLTKAGQTGGVPIEYQLMRLEIEPGLLDDISDSANNFVVVIKTSTGLLNQNQNQNQLMPPPPPPPAGFEGGTVRPSSPPPPPPPAGNSNGGNKGHVLVTDSRGMIEEANAMLASAMVNIGGQNLQPDVISKIDKIRLQLVELLAKKIPQREEKLNKKTGLNLPITTVNTSLVAIPQSDKLFKWDFDVLQITNTDHLLTVIYKLFESMRVIDELGVDFRVLATYVLDISTRYHDNPFHNLHHITGVTQFTYMLVFAMQGKGPAFLSPQQKFGILLSAVVHDVDHPGNTNLFEVNSSSQLALLYNDTAVLENHHCATAFAVLRRPGNNVMKNLNPVIVQELRKTIVECVMATDMSVHFDLVNRARALANTSGGYCN